MVGDQTEYINIIIDIYLYIIDSYIVYIISMLFV